MLAGTAERTFEPGRKVSRAEFTAMLVRALKLTDKGTVTFSDVKPDAWYADSIALAVKAGIVTGKSTTLFGTNDQITREEMVTMLMRSYELLNGKALASIPFCL